MTHSLDYRVLLAFLHSALQPKLYVEIGVGAGASLALADPAITHSVAIDPDPKLAFEPKNTTLAIATSDSFFAHAPNLDRVRNFDLALIDGLSVFDQALRDFRNLEAVAGRQSLIAIRHAIPMGNDCDVWRLMAAIVRGRRDLTAFTVAVPPSGMGIVGGFGTSPMAIANWQPHLIGDEEGRPVDTDWPTLIRLLNIVPNEGPAIAAALSRQWPPNPDRPYRIGSDAPAVIAPSATLAEIAP